MNIDQLSESVQVLAVVLFGSAARKNGDAFSDRDIFVLCKDLPLAELLKLKQNFILPRVGEGDGVSCYRHKDVLLMVRKGSLFLWHLKLQGNIIFSKDGVLEKIFAMLKPYENYEKDLNDCVDLLGDVKKYLAKWKEPNEFDLSVLFTITRNACILLCYHSGNPKFGRSNAYMTAKRIFGQNFPLSDWVYPRLCAWKLWYERGIEPHGDIGDESELEAIVEEVGTLLEFARGQCL